MIEATLALSVVAIDALNAVCEAALALNEVAKDELLLVIAFDCVASVK